MNSRERILCVDDEESILHSLKRLFFDEEYEVLTATSGDEGFRLLTECPQVQVVISDYRMPGMNGVQFLRAVSARWPETVRILLSGYSDIKAIIEAVNEGRIYKFIGKPWNDDELKISVANALERWHLFRRNEELSAQLQRANNDLRFLNAILQERITNEVSTLRKRLTSLELTGSLLDLLPVAVAGLDADGWISYYNKQMAGLFSWRGRDMLFSPRERVFPPELNGLVDAALRENAVSGPLKLDTKTVFARVERGTAPDGKPCVVLVFDEGVVDAAGRMS